MMTEKSIMQHILTGEPAYYKERGIISKVTIIDYTDNIVTFRTSDMPKVDTKCNLTTTRFHMYENKECKKTSRKFLFLDIDGVMNYSEMWNLPMEEQISDDKLKLLKKIVDATDCEIVLSSSWRNIDRHMHIIGGNLAKYGIDLVYKTPYDINGNAKRGDEIRSFLSLYSDFDVETRFVILDDDSDMCEFTDKYLVKTNYDVGLTEEDAEKAIDILNNSEPYKYNV